MKKESSYNADKNEIQVKQTQRFEALFNYASIGILLTDSDGNIILVHINISIQPV